MKKGNNSSLFLITFFTLQTLREECVKLQTRVQDLEHQNKELNYLFQQKMNYSSDQFLHVS
jgi:hypothetical protein